MFEIKEVHERILNILRNRGPSLPIQIAKEMNMNSLFISAFLSELSKEKKIIISSLKVGGSPLYFLNEQAEQLENFYKHLPPKEIEAFLFIKKEKLLKDSEQEPAIRVALRSIKDFAAGFKKNDEIFWRYLFSPESEIIEKISKYSREIPKQQIIEEAKKSKLEIKQEIKEEKIQKPIEIKSISEKQKEKELKKKQTQEIFLEEVKFYLKQKNIELINLESYDKKALIAKIRLSLTPEKIHLLFAYNKKKINDKELLKAYKKAMQYKLNYVVLFKGEFSKKLKDTIEAYKNLLSTEKL